MGRLEPTVFTVVCIVVAHQLIPTTNASHQDIQCLDVLKSQDKILNKLVIGQKECPLKIGTGSRPTDRMLALLLQAILRQWVGYEKVELVDGDYDYEGWLKVTSCLKQSSPDGCCEAPMLHLSLAEIENEDEILAKYVPKRVHPMGELGPRLRRGWFVLSEKFHEIERLNPSYRLDHWSFFTNRTLAEQFTFNKKQIEAYTKRNGTSCWCDKSQYNKCDDTGQFIPPQCRNVTCATLLASFPHENYNALVKQITELQLYVKVAWLGKGFEKLVKYHQNNTLFFDYSTSPLTYNVSHTTEVLFPSCGMNQDEKGCIFHSVKLRKFIWSILRNTAKPVYHLMNNFKLTAEEYQKLMEEFQPTNDDEGLLNMICNVGKQHWLSMNKWMDNVKVYPEIVVQIIVPNNESAVSNVTNFALDTINNDQKLLRGYILNQTVIKGDCNPKTVLEAFIHNSNDETIAIVGPECNGTLDELIRRTSSPNLTHTVLSYEMDSGILHNMDLQKNFFRLTPDISTVFKGYIQLFENFAWTQFVHFHEKNTDSNLQTIVDKHKMRMDDVIYDGVSSLQTIKNKGKRIIVADFHKKNGLEIMCEAHKLKMTWRERYVWLFPPWLPLNWFNITNAELPDNCTKEELHDALNFTFTYSSLETENVNFTIEAGFPNVSVWKSTYNKTLSPYAGYAYDAIWALAKSLDRMNQSSIPPLHDTDRAGFLEKLIEAMKTTNFSGVTGEVHFNNSERRPQNIILFQFNTVGGYKRIASFSMGLCNGAKKTSSSTYSSSLISEGDFRMENEPEWPEWGRPSDTDEECPLIFRFAEQYIECSTSKIIVFVIVVVVVILVPIILAISVSRYYERKMRKIEQQQQQPFGSLSDFELREDSVRIYRSLGEGAFGKVYLGQYRADESCVLPVAVKAAKDPKNLNAKMELLSEAEVMKMFEHVNILRLIGVITQHDKCMIVTEFMMYGNLKSYLQDRRHLAIKLEIDAAHLTRMALDISRGLSYLASLNYVHGDLACRNCLVHETLTIKIADFGFCKNLVDQDYYRLVRSGPMPVRWMSPELLSTGVYHVQSDIWSFGVVLYEIITFGAYPYGDLDDHQVQEYIRNGGFPTLPQKISSKLEALFLRIWTLRKEDRPTALELFEILAADPEIVHPSLEETPTRIDYIRLEAQGRHSKGSLSANRPNLNRRATNPKIRNETIEMVRLD